MVQAPAFDGAGPQHRVVAILAQQQGDGVAGGGVDGQEGEGDRGPQDEDGAQDPGDDEAGQGAAAGPRVGLRGLLERPTQGGVGDKMLHACSI